MSDLKYKMLYEGGSNITQLVKNALLSNEEPGRGKLEFLFWSPLKALSKIKY
jgi:hypothetical protein